jgi:hypothetical protein
MEAEYHPALQVAPTCELDNDSCLVAVTLCCKEAVELAADMLPATPAVFSDRWFYLTRGETPAERFVDPALGESVVEIRDADAEFAHVGASTIDAGKLLSAVARLAAFCLARRHCNGVVDSDDECLVRWLNNVADANVAERILVWLDHPPADG